MEGGHSIEEVVAEEAESSTAEREEAAKGAAWTVGSVLGLDRAWGFSRANRDGREQRGDTWGPICTG